jgi:uncharacterized protein (DUF697 family)
MTSLTDTKDETMKQTIDDWVKRADDAHQIVRKYALAGMAVGLIPLPLIDLAAMTAVQLKMAHRISEQYQVPFSRDAAKSVIASLLSSVVATSAALSLSSVVKVVPLIGSVSGAASMVVLSGASTYAIGKVFIQHFESGGTFLNFDPEKMRERFRAFYEEGKHFVTVQQAVDKTTATASTAVG